MSIHGYEIRIERRRRFGPFKWHGNFVAFTDARRVLGISPEYGWSSWSRSGIERKMRRVVAREQQKQQRRDAVEVISLDVEK